jgi:hypothetical protein
MLIESVTDISGPIVNSPLAMLDYRSIDQEKDTFLNGNMFGVGIRFFHSPKHQWHYIRHQMPDEVFMFKCYDSLQGSDGSALYACHTAATRDDSEDVPVELRNIRQSVEIRMIAIWE